MTVFMQNAIETLFYGVDISGADLSVKKVLFLNARDDDRVSGDWFFVQGFKPYCIEFNVLKPMSFSEISDSDFDVVLYLLPKNMVEARYGVAQAMQVLRRDGVLYCAADNKAGGARLKGIFEDFGLSIDGVEARNKARVMWGGVRDYDHDALKNALIVGGVQTILDGRFLSQPGLFGWNKIDKGSEILIQNIRDDLKGRGADFGCGYGYLSDYILSYFSDIRHLTCLDADYRAVDICRRNLQKYDVGQSYMWADLTTPREDLENLDFIVMNPPFHDGKNQDFSVGQAFIRSAHLSLRRGGVLWMVANAHLPYENILGEVFDQSEKLYEGSGFKVFKAVK